MLENQNLKRKREGSTSPPPPQIKLLIRPQGATHDHQPNLKDPSSAQPAPKRSRNRKDRWANAPTTGVNVDGYVKETDPVLYSAVTSFQHKAGIITQINATAGHLKLGRNSELVFHRITVEDQAKVIKKANAYAPLIITSNCRYKIPEQTKGRRVNYVKAYLDSMKNTEVTALMDDTKQALEDLEDTNRSMAVYRDGDDLLERVRTSCFTVGQQKSLPKDAYKPMDEKRGLHERLAFPKLHCIPVGFYYAKWLEKLEYCLQSNPSKERSLTPPTHSSIASSSAATPSAERLALMEKRTAIFEDRADKYLTAKDKAVYKYRAERRKQWDSFSGSTTLSEQQYNEQYDEEQLAGALQASMRGKPQHNKKLAMVLPGKLAVRVSQGSPSLLSVGNNQERNPLTQNSLSLLF